jgi:GDP-L-fucose synthase
MPDLPFSTDGIDFYRGKTVVVPGATGLLGSWVVKLLRESGAHIRAVYHDREPNEFSGLADEFVRCHLMLPYDAREAVRGAEVVVNCAGVTGGVGIVAVNPTGYVGPATAMACNIIDACRAEHVPRMGFLSSTTVYAPQDGPVSEDILGDAPYKLYEGIGYSKRFLEQLCRYYHERAGMKIAVVRPSGAYGRFDNFDERTSHVVPGMIQRALGIKTDLGPDRSHADPTFEIWGDGEDVRDLIHAQDVARGYLLAIAQIEDATPINLASGEGVSTRHLAEMVLETLGSKVPITCNREKPSALRSRLVDISRARDRLGFEPQIQLDAGLEDTVGWYQKEQ